MANDDLFTDVEYVDHKYKKIDNGYSKKGKIVNDKFYDLTKKEENIEELDENEVINGRLEFLKKNVFKEVKLGSLLFICLVIFLIIFYEIFNKTIFINLLIIGSALFLITLTIYSIFIFKKVKKIKSNK